MEIRKFVKSTRKKNHIKESEVCAGLCSETQYRNYENGNRDLNIFVQKRVMERLGCSSWGMQFLLKNKEYACWKAEMEVLYALMEGRLDCIPEELNLIRQRYAKEPLHQQFVERMFSFYAILSNKRKDEIARYIENALACTVRNYKNIDQLNQLLSAGEWDLLLDYYYYEGVDNPRIFQQLAELIEKSILDEREKAIVYLKAVCYFAIAMNREGMDKWSDPNLKECYEMTTLALEFIQSVKSGYLLKEILEIRSELLVCLCRGSGEGESYKVAKKQTEVWLHAAEQAKQKIKEGNPFTINFQPYIMRDVEGVCDVLVRRMDMLGIDEEQMADELHMDIRTLASIRQETHNPQKAVAEELLGRMGLPRGYMQQLFFVESKEEEKIVEKFINIEKYGLNKEEMQEQMEWIDETVNLDLHYNRRELQWHQLWVDYKNNKLTKAEGAQKIKDLIEQCFPWECMGDGRSNYYFSYRELQYLCGFLQLANPESADFRFVLHRIEEYCKEKINTHEELNYASVLVMLLDQIQSIYGNAGNFNRSNHYCENLLRVSDHVGNMYRIEDTLYAMWWNKKEETSITDRETLSWLIDLANLIDDEIGEAFMREKLDSVCGR